MDRVYTDFLFPDVGFLVGAASIFSLGGYPVACNRSGNPTLADARALRQDFAMIGQDIKDVAAKLEEQPGQLKLL
jgi:hypothetical protein